MHLKPIFPITEEEKILVRVLLKLRIAVQRKNSIFVDEEKIRMKKTEIGNNPDCIILEDFENDFKKVPSVSLRHLLYREN